MINKKERYSKGKKKTVLAVIFFILAFAFIIGTVASYYSDIAEQTGDVTTSTLKIDSSYSFFLNGAEAQLDDIKSLNPGDVIVIKGTITNTGNQSAWIREKIVLNVEDEVLLPYLQVFDYEFSQEDILAGTAQDLHLDISPQGLATGINRVINGYGENAQTESGSDFFYIDSYTYDFAFTIYFAHSAPNITQQKTFGLTIATQALQFRNNNAAEPDETAWDLVRAD